MGREYELKYAATPEIRSKIRLEYPNFKTIQMETTYYDTMDGILGRLHWTVRRRLENGVSVVIFVPPLFSVYQPSKL